MRERVHGSVIAFALLGYRVVATLRARSVEAGFWLLAAASFFPVSQIVPLPFPIADRYLYGILPGLLGGLLLAGAPLLELVFVLPGSRDPESGVTGIDREALLHLAGDADLIDLSAQVALAPPVAPTASTEPVGLPFLLLAAILLPLEAWARRRARSASRLRRATPSA